MKVVLFGIGQYVDGIEKTLQDNVEVVHYIDNNPKKQNTYKKGKIIYSLAKCNSMEAEYIIISALNYMDIKNQLIENGFSEEIIIPFFQDDLNYEDYRELFKPLLSIQYRMECRINNLERKQKYIYDNYIYEMADILRKAKIELPRICSVEETCEKILNERVSLSRYGDGEFQIILGSAKDPYQDNNLKLANRLEEILISNVSNHIVALADDYGCMEGLREENKETIRKYMTKEKRLDHYKYLDMNKQYYNAYVSRPYVIYPHEERENAKRRFMKLKQIWENEKVVIVEGDITRMGVGNDLFDNVASLERIIAPNKNAFDVYNELLDTSLKLSKDRLILIALGPTATVLAYDLAKEGYWAIDIGHLDLEYEWYLKGEGYSKIPTKYNNEVIGDDEVIEIHDEEYDKSIIATIKLEDGENNNEK